jgi:hypothetical protein
MWGWGLGGAEGEEGGWERGGEGWGEEVRGWEGGGGEGDEAEVYHIPAEVSRRVRADCRPPLTQIACRVTGLGACESQAGSIKGHLTK